MNEQQLTEFIDKALSSTQDARSRISAILKAKAEQRLVEEPHIDEDVLLDALINLQDGYAKLISIAVDAGIIPF